MIANAFRCSRLLSVAVRCSLLVSDAFFSILLITIDAWCALKIIFVAFHRSALLCVSLCWFSMLSVASYCLWCCLCRSLSFSVALWCVHVFSRALRCFMLLPVLSATSACFLCFLFCSIAFSSFLLLSASSGVYYCLAIMSKESIVRDTHRAADRLLGWTIRIRFP